VWEGGNGLLGPSPSPLPLTPLHPAPAGRRVFWLIEMTTPVEVLRFVRARQRGAARIGGGGRAPDRRETGHVPRGPPSGPACLSATAEALGLRFRRALSSSDSRARVADEGGRCQGESELAVQEEPGDGDEGEDDGDQEDDGDHGRSPVGAEAG